MRPSNTNPKIVVLDRGDYTSCTINLHGATVTSWRINNKEMIFVSRESHFTGLSHIRGGIQFVFPVIGSWNFGPKHGFARDLEWQVEEGPKKADGGDVYALISLIDNAYTHSVWGYKFKLYYKVILCEFKLIFNIGVENSNAHYPFEFKIMQHSLLRVPDVTKCEITGFKLCNYKEGMENKTVLVEQREKVLISKMTDRIYINAPDEVLVSNTVNGGAMRLIKKRTFDINLWNPWADQSKKIHDLGNDEYVNFIAVEAGMVVKKIRIDPMSCWEAFQTFEYVEPKMKKETKNFIDLFDGYC